MNRRLALADKSKIPLLLSLSVRRLGAIGFAGSDRTADRDAGPRNDGECAQLAILQNLNTALTGRRQVDAPPAWAAPMPRCGALAIRVCDRNCKRWP